MAQNNLGRNGAADAGNVIGVVLGLVVVGFIVIAFVMPALTKKDDPFKSRPGANSAGAGFRQPWEPDPVEVEKQRQREAEARRRFEQDQARLSERLNQSEQQIRSFDREDTYQDAVAMVNALS